jgi:threonyl-tRNA synthetase
VKEELQSRGFRAIIDQRNESLNKRIRESTVKKIPYVLVVGDKEMKDTAVAVRKYGEGDQGACALDAFVERIQEETQLKKR